VTTRLPSRFLPAALVLHFGLLVIWLTTGPARSGPSLEEARRTSVLLGGQAHPMALWAVLNGVAGVLLLAGWLRHSRHLRLAGWVWGSAVTAFLASTQWVSAAHSPTGSLSAPLFTSIAVLAHIVAASSRGGERR